MMKMLILALYVAASAAAGVSGAETVAKSSVEQFVAPVLLPVREDARGELVDLPLENCTVHTATSPDMRRMNIVPCGTGSPLEVPGKYYMWIEKEGLVSRDIAVVVGGGPAQIAQGPGFIALVPAGSVVPSDGFRWQRGGTFRVISLERESSALFERRAHHLDEAKQGILAPAGRAVAGMFDDHGNAITLTEPFIVSARDTKVVDPAASNAAGAVFAHIWRPADHHRAAVNLRLVTANARRPPDVIRDNGTRLYAIWYAVAPGEASIEVESSALGSSFPLLVRKATVATVRAPLTGRKARVK